MGEVVAKQLSAFFTPDEVRLIFENSVRYYEAARSIDGLTMPKPVSHTNTELTFEKLPGMGETLEEAWFHGRRWDAGLCRRIGYFLGRLHKAQSAAPDLSGKIYLHGDFVPHNIVVREEDVVFFDCEPPGLHADFMHFYRNYNYIDLASFIFFVFISHSFKRPWRFLRNKRPFVRAFLSGYERGASFVCDRNVLLRYIKEECHKWYKDSRRHLVRKLMEYGILRVTLFAQLRLYRVLYVTT